MYGQCFAIDEEVIEDVINITTSTRLAYYNNMLIIAQHKICFIGTL